MTAATITAPPGGLPFNVITPLGYALSQTPHAVSRPQAATGANCNEFLRGGSINYAFVRDDVIPPFPQLVWRVTDQSGSIAHEFDPRAGVGP